MMLKVLLRTARAMGPCWVGEVDDIATASDVLTDFCRTYHLNRESCTLFHLQGGKLPPKQLLRKIRKPPGHKFIPLTVEVQEPTLSFLPGSKWLSISAPTASDRQALSEVWYDTAMAHSSAATYAATAMSDIDTLVDLVQCKHTDILSSSVAQSTLKAAAVETASAASRPLILLIHALGTLAASRQQQAALIPGLRNVRLEAEMRRLAVQPSQDEPNKENVGKLDQSAMTALLRCAILLLKLVDLKPARAAADAHAALWMTIPCLLMGLREHMQADSATDSVYDQPPGSASEQQQLVRVLVQLVLRMIAHSQSQGLLQSGAMVFFQLLMCLMGTPATQPTALSAMCTKDGMALIANGLAQAKPYAKVASHLIFTILSANLTTESRDATLKVIADMQGVRRVSNLLCPTLDNTLEYDIRCASSVYKSKSVTYKSPADTDPHLAILLPIPLLMGAMLYGFRV